MTLTIDDVALTFDVPPLSGKRSINTGAITMITEMGKVSEETKGVSGPYLELPAGLKKRM